MLIEEVRVTFASVKLSDPITSLAAMGVEYFRENATVQVFFHSITAYNLVSSLSKATKL